MQCIRGSASYPQKRLSNLVSHIRFLHFIHVISRQNFESILQSQIYPDSTMALESFTVRTDGEISWYCERRGNGPHLILVPSGEGDCFPFAKTASSLASSFTVTTFDMPGMSRATAPRHCYQDVTASLLADQIVRLMDKLLINTATFFGSSSGGAAVLDR